MRTHSDYEEILTRHHLPLPYPGAVLSNLRLHKSVDWYALTDKGWYWYSGREGWKFCPYGPSWDMSGGLK